MNLMNTLPLHPKSKAAPIIEPDRIPTVTIHPSVRVGSVPYLNAKPLTRFLKSPVTAMEPNQLAAELRAGNLDVALVPLMEVLEAPEGAYRIANDIAIGSERSVFSVYLNYSV